MSAEEPQPDPGATMDKGFIVGAVVGLIVLVSMTSVASCIRGEESGEEGSSIQEPRPLASAEAES